MSPPSQAAQERSPLFPPPDERRRLAVLLATALDGLDARIAGGSVTPTLEVAAFHDELARLDFEHPQALDTLLPWVVSRLEQGLVQITHPRYFGLFNPAPSFPALCAEPIVAAFNPQLASATTSPAAVAIEARVIGAVAERAGFPANAAGHFTSGGSEANATALICALTRAHPNFAQAGTRCFDGPPTLYISREAHLAWVKIAHQTGIGRSAARLVATDGSGRMDMAALARAIAEDRDRGCVPIMVAATAGTTGAGMVDDLPACADLARASRLWFHVDAAWGGALIAIGPQCLAAGGALAGLDRADSLTIDAHKWFATTMGCGMFVTRHAATLPLAFQVSNDFMPSNAADADPYVSSLQWSRRFLGLRLFLSLASAGWSGYAAHVNRAIALADLLARELQSLGWTVVNRSPLAVLCLEPPPGSPDAAAIVRRVVKSGEAWISTAVLEGRPVVRACISNGMTVENDVAGLVAALEKARQAVLF